MKCFVCGESVTRFFFVMWCDECIDECLELRQKGNIINVDEFVRMKKAQQ